MNTVAFRCLMIWYYVIADSTKLSLRSVFCLCVLTDRLYFLEETFGKILVTIIAHIEIWFFRHAELILAFLVESISAQYLKTYVSKT